MTREQHIIITPHITNIIKIGQKINIGGNKQQQNIVIPTVNTKHSINAQINIIDNIVNITKNTINPSVNIDMQNILKHKTGYIINIGISKIRYQKHNSIGTDAIIKPIQARI